jgi:DNA-directed RNA polymerase specialized sigma24 family protein
MQIALSRLPVDRRRAIQMRYIDGQTPQEIAGKMQKSAAAVKGLLFHGLRELRERLGDAKRFFSDARSSDAADE